jgi:hypothetical protein
MQAKASQSRPAAIPAISKSTELQPQGQPASAVSSSRFHAAVFVFAVVVVAVACSFVCHPVRDLRLPLPLHALAFLLFIPEGDLPLPLKNPSPLLTTRPSTASPHPSQFIISPLDANPGTVYSLPIFDALAPLANPVAVLRRTISAATSPRFQFIQSPESFAAAFNPVPPDGGQHTT